MNLLKRFLLIILTSAAITNLSAAEKEAAQTPAGPTYHAAALYECKGPVKEFTLATDNPVARQKKVKFAKDGKLKKSVLDYNEAGYPSGCDMSMLGKHMVVRIDYDADNQPVKFLLDSNVGTDLNVTVTQTYSDGVMTGADWYDNKSGRHLIHSEYTDHQFDDHGNWIHRTATNTTFSAPDESTGETATESKTYPEERTILYY